MITRNAINPGKYSRQPKKIPYRFIYASGAVRGLEHLLELIPRVHSQFPETTLHIFSNLDSYNEKGNNQQLKDGKINFIEISNKEKHMLMVNM